MNDLEICKLNRLPHMCGAEGARTDRSLRARLIRGGWLAPPVERESTPFYNLERLPVLKLDRIGARSAIGDMIHGKLRETAVLTASVRNGERQPKNGVAA